MLSLQGIRLIDWTVHVQGPVCSMILGDLGAEVIKIEQRGLGDPARTSRLMVGHNPMIAGRNYYFESMNRNKKSLTLDLGKAEGREVVRRLAAKSDVFVQNFRPGVADKLGVGYEALRPSNPRLIYASGSGFGPKGPDTRRGAYDGLGQARSGLMEAAAPTGMPPQPIAWGIVDQVSGFALAFGIMVALWTRDKLGVGQQVDASLLGSAMWVQALSVNSSLALGKEAVKFSRDDAGNPLYNSYQCADGLWIFLGMSRPDKPWHEFCVATGLENIEDDPRFRDAQSRTRHRQEMIRLLEDVFASKPRAEWVERLKLFPALIFDNVNHFSDLIRDPQVIASGYIVDFDHPTMGPMKMLANPVTFSETPGEIRMPAPELGQHTEEILGEVCGYTQSEIARLRELEVI